MGKKDKKEKKEKKVKKEKTGPKRAKTAYICFVEERRPKVVKENPKLQAKEILSKLGAEWKAMKEADKKKYVDLAEKDKARYNKEKAAMEGKKSAKKQ